MAAAVCPLRGLSVAVSICVALLLSFAAHFANKLQTVHKVYSTARGLGRVATLAARQGHGFWV